MLNNPVDVDRENCAASLCSSPASHRHVGGKERRLMILYKFLSDTNFRTYWSSYSTGHFYFSSWRKFNDPMEGFFSYVANRPSQTAAAWNITSQKDQFTVLCMAEEKSHMLMWSHYAQDHKGVCLEVEIDDALLLTNGICLEKVKYPNRIPILSQSGSPQKQAKRMLTRKLFFWRYEKEHRLLAQSTTPALHQIGTLKKVIFGKRFGFSPGEEGLRSSMISQLRSNNVSIHQADFDFQTYRIESQQTNRYG